MFESKFLIREDRDTASNRIRMIAESKFFTDRKSKPVVVCSKWYHENNVDKDEMMADVQEQIRKFVELRTKYTIKKTIVFILAIFASLGIIGFLHNVF